MKASSRTVSIACAALCAAALVAGFSSRSRRAGLERAASSVEARIAEKLAPELALDEQWRSAAADFPRISGPLPALFARPDARHGRGSGRFVPSCGATLVEESIVLPRQKLAELSVAVEEAKAAGYRPARIALDSLGGGFVRCEIVLAGLDEKR